MYAVIETGGKQYQVKEGDEIFIEKLAQSEGEVVFDKVIMVGGDASPKIGEPYVNSASVKGTVIKNGKAKKITVFTYKPKKGSKRKLGHRQPYSKVKIEAINA
ncbi:MAG: 50S ribosomal protein L21 [Oscillospiraceae bacterium]|nr:50S ribosomal protein L21 [Oscillospiraceae bacterium]